MSPEEIDGLVAEVDAMRGRLADDLPSDARRRVVGVAAHHLAEGRSGLELRRACRGDLKRAGFNPMWILLAVKIIVPIVQWVIERRRLRNATEQPCLDSAAPPAP